MTELKSFKPEHVTPWFAREYKGIFLGAGIKIVIFALAAAFGITAYLIKTIPHYDLLNREAWACGTFVCAYATTSALTHIIGYLLFIPLGIFVYNNYIKKKGRHSK